MPKIYGIIIYVSDKLWGCLKNKNNYLKVIILKNVFIKKGV